MGFSSKREIATELFRLTGFMPYLGDRHTCEFFPWYITSKKNMKKYKIVRTSIKERKEGFAQRDKELRSMIKGKIPEFYHQQSRETAADIIAAHSQGKVFIDVGNLPNIGQISNLPPAAVVETAMRVDGNGFAPVTYGDLPESVVGFIEPYARVYQMVVDACFAKDKRMALQALRYDPVCSHLNTDETNEMGERLLRANKKFISAY